jgi:hypothetical protein
MDHNDDRKITREEGEGLARLFGRMKMLMMVDHSLHPECPKFPEDPGLPFGEFRWITEIKKAVKTFYP